MRYPGSGQGPLPLPRLACLIGLLLLNIANVAAHSTYDDSPDVVQKSFDVVAVDVDIIDIVSIQRISKLPITAAPRRPRPGFDPDRKLVVARKASSTCPSSFSLCPASLSGGCCPTGFACDVSDCVQTSVASGAASTTELACGKAGYTGCGVADGGGCCPSGYTCGRLSCTPPATGAATESQSCPSAYYLCPASLDYGCCATSMGCALSGCYSTAPTTVVVTRTYTTATGAGSSRVTTVTSTTVETPTPPTETAGGSTGSGDSSTTTTDGIAYVAKLVPTTTAKASLVAVSGSSDSGSDSGGGLSRGAIGGLIGGLVALLVAIAVAAYFIIKNVRRTSKELGEVKRLSGSDKSRKKHSDINRIKDNPAGSGSTSKTRASLHHPTPSVINHMEVDDLLERAPTGVDGETSSSGIGHSFRNQGQTQVSSTSTPAQPSVGGASSGYFDIPQRTHNRPGHYPQGSDPRVSMDSSGIAHARNASSTSNAGSATAAFSPLTGVYTPGVGSPHQPAELGIDGGFIPELPVVAPSPTSPLTPPTTTTTTTESTSARPRPFSNISAVSGLSYAGFSPSLPQQQQQQQQQQPLMANYGHQRTWSDSSASTTGGANTPLHAPPPPPTQQQTTTTTSPPQPQLDVVVEEHLHGHYGPDHEVAGQTRR